MSVKLGDTDIAGTQVLYSTTGNNTDGAMTQNATTNELNNCIHKTGNETISGDKTFNNLIHFKNSVYVDAAAGDEGGEIEFAKAPNSSLIGNVHLDIYKNSMRVFGPASNGNFNTVMTADIEQNALFAPASDTSGSIVTTVGINKSGNGYVKLGNGLIIQWGSVSSSDYSQLTITLPIPFSNTDYKVVLTQEYNNTGEYNANAYVRSKTTTNFNILGQKTAIAYIAVGY